MARARLSFRRSRKFPSPLLHRISPKPWHSRWTLRSLLLLQEPKNPLLPRPPPRSCEHAAAPFDAVIGTMIRGAIAIRMGRADSLACGKSINNQSEARRRIDLSQSPD